MEPAKQTREQGEETGKGPSSQASPSKQSRWEGDLGGSVNLPIVLTGIL